MISPITLSAEKRTVSGRQVKSLRHQGILPANIYGKNIKSQSIQLSLLNFQKAFSQAGETNLINLAIKEEAKPRPVLVSNVQLDPITDEPIHADFHQVDLKEKVTAEVPIELIGEAPAVKEKDAVLFQVHTEIEVEALPTDLIDKIEVDVTKLTDIGQSILVKDLKVDRQKISLQIDDAEPIVIIQEKKEEEEITPPPAEVAPEEEKEEKAEAETEIKPEEKQAGKPEEAKPEEKPTEAPAAEKKAASEEKEKK